MQQPGPVHGAHSTQSVGGGTGSLLKAGVTLEGDEVHVERRGVGGGLSVVQGRRSVDADQRGAGHTWRVKKVVTKFWLLWKKYNPIAGSYLSS